MARFILLFLSLATSNNKDSKKIYIEPLYKDEEIVTGYLSGYNEGVMQVSIDYYDNLNMAGWCGWECRQASELDGYITVAHCYRIGDHATLIVDNVVYKVLVVDCIAQQHIVAGNIFDPSRGYIAELDFELFNIVKRRYGTVAYN